MTSITQQQIWRARAQLVALALLHPIPNPVARVLLRPFRRWLWPTHPTAMANLRRRVAMQLASSLKPDEQR